jgi:hypothetical protein
MIQFSEELKQLLSVILTNSNSSVLDTDFKFSIVERDIDRNAAFKCEFRGISYQVEQYLLESLFIWHNSFWDCQIHYVVQVQSFLRNLEVHYLTDFLDRSSDVKLSEMHFELSIFYAAQI